MENVIAEMVEGFEKGVLSRRQLIQGLAMLAAAGGAGTANAQQAPFNATRVDHVSVQTPDLPASMEFYKKVFGFKVLNADKPHEIVRMGTQRILVSLHHKAPTGIVDHFGIAVEGFDPKSAAESLAQLGLEAHENLDYGFYVRDPAGIPVQLVRS